MRHPIGHRCPFHPKQAASQLNDAPCAYALAPSVVANKNTHGPFSTFYIETSVWGSLAPRQPADRKKVVKKLLQLLKDCQGSCVISIAVIDEIMEAPAEVSAAIHRHLKSTGPTIYAITTEVENLAQAYLHAGVLPEKRLFDAMHVAAATCYNCDYLVSWNHRHLTRPKKKVQYDAVNRLHGYWKPPMICNPVEACDELRSG